MTTNTNHQKNKQLVWSFLQELNNATPDNIKNIFSKYHSTDATFNISYPFNIIKGIDKYIDIFWKDFLHAFPNRTRVESVYFSGDFDDKQWVTVTGNYCAEFEHDWLGIPANNKITYIRYGEFYQIENNKIVDTYILYDIVDIIRQAGITLLPSSLGTEIPFPLPQTQDGILLNQQPDEASRASLKLVEDMIFIGLRDRSKDEYASRGAERYWHPKVMWYGPCGIGSTRGIDGFQKQHQEPFIRAFPDRVGGNHKARFAEGSYIASTGWPSINATHTGEGWLGLAPTDKKITMRVMDFWRREESLLVENWVFIDFLD
ncbi:ester cyclase [Francisella sp. 19X1-34]|uniref:nuclear transport factor 2 family protein n=1 Tax=Francisella sp. 19X1-34 TaxID=3087177 RepID=UPI002E32529E|nr:ester cyclase [Francisella sp. 19X1-34]MED7789614.1 ester cyclase [Francisella sp. 19X1-34]